MIIDFLLFLCQWYKDFVHAVRIGLTLFSARVS